MLLHVPSEKVFISRFAERKSRKQACSLSEPGICNAIRSYEKRKVFKEKKRKDLAVLAKTLRLNSFF